MSTGLKVVVALGLLCVFITTMDWMYWWTWVRGKQKPQAPDSALFDRYQRRHRELAEHQIPSMSKQWRKQARRTDGDAA
jgi:hypothetical protein